MTLETEPSETPGARLARRLKTLRRERHWTLDKLSLACGVSRSMLSQIERGAANPTLAVTFAIARAFGLSLGELVDEPGASPSVHVVRAQDTSYVLREDAECTIRVLTPLRFEGEVELYEVALQPGCALRSDAHVPGAREIVTVKEGHATVEAGNESVSLAPGDTVSYRADIAHAIVNPGSEASVVMLVDAYD